MLDDDRLAAQQLTQEAEKVVDAPIKPSEDPRSDHLQQASTEDPTTIVNDLALHTPSKSASSTRNPTKRKRQESLKPDLSPRKRRHAATEIEELIRPPSRTVQNVPGKLKRPSAKALGRDEAAHPATPSKKKRGRPRKDTPNIDSDNVEIPESDVNRATTHNADLAAKSPQEVYDVSSFGDEFEDHGGVAGNESKNADIVSTTRPEHNPRKSSKGSQSSASGPNSSRVQANVGSSPQDPKISRANLNKHLQETSSQPSAEQAVKDLNGSSEEPNGLEVEDGGEAGNERAEDEHSVRSSSTLFLGNDEELSRQLKLYGQEDLWEKILEGARSVNLTDEGERFKPKARTNMIRTLTEGTKAARNDLRNLADHEDLSQDELDCLFLQLVNRIDELYLQVRNMQEEENCDESSEIVKEIYTCAIPAMIFLLERCLNFHALQDTCESGLRVLHEVVRLQKIILLLCEKVKAWKAKPISGRPIIKPIKFKVFPSLRYMSKIFRKELENQKIMLKRKENAARVRENEQKELQEAEERQRAEQVWDRNNTQKMFQSIRSEGNRIRISMGKSPAYNRKDRAASVHYVNPSQSHGKTRWTSQEECELLVQLMRPDLRELPGTLAVLNFLVAACC